MATKTKNNMKPNPNAIAILQDLFTKDELVQIVERLKEQNYHTDNVLCYEKPLAFPEDRNTIDGFTIIVGGLFHKNTEIYQKCLTNLGTETLKTKLFLNN
jgi:hypothetical protein